MAPACPPGPHAARRRLASASLIRALSAIAVAAFVALGCAPGGAGGSSSVIAPDGGAGSDGDGPGPQDSGHRADTSGQADAGADTAAELGDAAAGNDAASDGAGTGADGAASGGDAADADAGATVGGWGPTMCPKVDAQGFGVGQSIGALQLKDCDTGEVRTINEACGAKAGWLFVAHSHCPTCQATANYTAAVAAAVAADDVAVLHVLYVDDATTCQGWRSKYGLDLPPNVRFYVDPTGAAWQAIKIKNYTAPHVFFNKNRIITYKEHGLSSASVKAQIQKAAATN